MVAKAFGLADRAHEIANTVDTVFAIASGTKGFTALTVMSLVQDGALSLSTTARSVLGGDLPLIDDAVTVEHLLAHRSGIGDYSFRSVSDPEERYTATVVSNTSESAWPVIERLDELVLNGPPRASR